MIEYRTGNILDADAEALVNSVNCVGIMGRGIALQFKEAYPANFEAYRDACAHGDVQPGRMFVFKTNALTNPKYIINFPTKRHWRGKSRIEDIQSGLEALAGEIRALNIRSIAIPPLGSGLGGLDWKQVRPRIEAALRSFDVVRVILFEPGGVADTKAVRLREVPAMTPGRAALVVLIQRYLAGLMDPFVTLLEVHKLMYFLQEAGEPLKLRYSKAVYGPYAENLRHVLQKVEGHYVYGYANGGDAPNRPLKLVPGARQDAEQFLGSRSDTLARINRVAELIEGFETPFGLELLSTAHWVATREDAMNADQVVERTYAWNERKRRFSLRQITLAFSVLRNKGWLSEEHVGK